MAVAWAVPWPARRTLRLRDLLDGDDRARITPQASRGGEAPRGAVVALDTTTGPTGQFG
jgi:hypothetical protein